VSKRTLLIAGLAVALAGSIVALAGGAGSQVPGVNGVNSADIAPRNVKASDVAKPRWQSLPTQNGWAAYGGSTRPSKVSKDSFGFVHLRGTIKRNSGSSLNPFRLPNTMRPRVTIFLTVAVNPNSAAHLRIDPSGQATLESGGGSSPQTLTSLEGVSFIP
jgi:hypothetical protein